MYMKKPPMIVIDGSFKMSFVAKKIEKKMIIGLEHEGIFGRFKKKWQLKNMLELGIPCSKRT